jgi:DNA-binding NtrC family response regulator
MSSWLRVQVVPLEEVPQGIESADACRPIVLVVDDEVLIADTVSLVLRQRGFLAMPAYGARGALEIIESHEPELLLTDFAMPGMNGVELANEVQRRHPACKVLLFSGHVEMHRAHSVRCSGYSLLNKPLHPVDLIQAISTALGYPAGQAAYS